MNYFSAHVLDSCEVGAYTLLTVGGCEALAGARPGQFVMARGFWGRDPILPRAFSILSVEQGRARFLVKPVGRGSSLLARLHQGDTIQLLGPLGNGFPEPAEGVVLVAGGCGLPPLFMLARQHPAACELLLGARSPEQIPESLIEQLREQGTSVACISEENGGGQQGLVTDLLGRRLARGETGGVMACGPEGMLRAVRELTRQHKVRCWMSLEAEMACGIGACLGCAVERPGGGYLHVCVDGPVFEAEEVWP